MANLASMYWNQGRWKEAKELEVQVMKACKTKLTKILGRVTKACFFGMYSLVYIKSAWRCRASAHDVSGLTRQLRQNAKKLIRGVCVRLKCNHQNVDLTG